MRGLGREEGGRKEGGGGGLTRKVEEETEYKHHTQTESVVLPS